jgi:hypothetical protein
MKKGGGCKAPPFRHDNFVANRNTTVEKIGEKIWYQIGYILQIITVDSILFKKNFSKAGNSPSFCSGRQKQRAG